LRPERADICINFATDPVTNFERIIEIVVQETSILQKTRDHYRHYQQQGMDMHLHKL
ncbi:MAG: DNA polymerase III subunit chi, partial [Gammaproteobacteria bacterium]|nr:DNA polymerase III subunit chi [Gammaproteobacteria bacterium]